MPGKCSPHQQATTLAQAAALKPYVQVNTVSGVQRASRKIVVVQTCDASYSRDLRQEDVLQHKFKDSLNNSAGALNNPGEVVHAWNSKHLEGRGMKVRGLGASLNHIVYGG